MKPTHTRRWTAGVVGAVVLVGGCGGGSELGDGSPFGQTDDLEGVDIEDLEGSDGSAMFGESAPGALEAGPVTVLADPGHALVSVDGRTIDHTPDEFGGGFRCSFSDDQITFEVNSAIGTMVLTASRDEDGWIDRFTADSDEGQQDDWIQYSAQPFDGELGIDMDSKTLSYVGTAMRQDRGAMSDGDLDTPTVEVTVAVNCGIDPAVVEVGGQTFTGSFEHTSDVDPDLLEEFEGTATVACSS